jgi:hypothetical protein
VERPTEDLVGLGDHRGPVGIDHHDRPDRRQAKVDDAADRVRFKTAL